MPAFDFWNERLFCNDTSPQPAPLYEEGQTFFPVFTTSIIVTHERLKIPTVRREAFP